MRLEKRLTRYWSPVSCADTVLHTLTKGNSAKHGIDVVLRYLAAGWIVFDSKVGRPLTILTSPTDPLQALGLFASEGGAKVGVLYIAV